MATTIKIYFGIVRTTPNSSCGSVLWKEPSEERSPLLKCCVPLEAWYSISAQSCLCSRMYFALSEGCASRDKKRKKKAEECTSDVSNYNHKMQMLIASG